MRNTLAVLFLASGCDLVFLNPPEPLPEFCDPLVSADPPTTDNDADSVIAREDNCPATKNTDQSDEDDDCRGDVCDACPWRGDVDSDGPDSDGDGLADACDRDNGTLRFFDPFTTPLAWSVVTIAYTGTFELEGGAWVVRTADPAAALEITPDTRSGAAHVGFRIPDATLTGTGAFSVGVLVASFVVPSGITGKRISVARDAGDPQLWFRIETLAANVPTIESQNVITQRLFGKQLRIDVDYGPTVTARLAIDTRFQEPPLTGTAGGDGKIGVTAIGSPASFEFVAHVH